MTSVSNEQPVVIVGVDGSPNSLAALEWAINFAAGQGGGTVKAVMSWTYPAAAVGSMGIGGVMPPAESMHEASAEALDEILADVVAPDSVTVQPVIAEGGASPVPMAESRVFFAADAGGATPIVPGDAEVTATVTVTYEIEN